MVSILEKLSKEVKINAPSFLISNIHYETLMGSHAYGCNSPDSSDFDVYGFCIPPKELIFPHLRGEILGFDQQVTRFEQHQTHNIVVPSSKRGYDITYYNIVKYFRLCADCSPNIIDSLFTPAECVLHISRIGNMVRESRKLFLSKKSFASFRGYAFSQLAKVKNKEYKNSKRREEVETLGFSTKNAYHLVRLMDEAEQILIEGDIDLRKNKEHYKAIRRGDFSLEEIQVWFSEKEKNLEKLYVSSNAVPHKIREVEIKELLVTCLEEHYGSLQNIIKLTKDEEKYEKAIKEIKNILQEV